MMHILAEIGNERRRQDELWGLGQLGIPDGTGHEKFKELAGEARIECDRATAAMEVTFMHVLLEEVMEALAESDEDRLRVELIQVAAVAAKWVQAIDRRRVLRDHHQEGLGACSCGARHDGPGWWSRHIVEAVMSS